MYVLISLDDHTVIYRHSDLNTVLSLAHIECPDIGFSCFSDDDVRHYLGFGILALRQLYKNISGQEPASNLPSRLLAPQIRDMIQWIPESDVRVWEVEQQARKADGVIRHRYVKGAYTPTVITEMFDSGEHPLPSLSLTPEQAKQAIAGVPVPQPVQRQAPQAGQYVQVVGRAQQQPQPQPQAAQAPQPAQQQGTVPSWLAGWKK